MDPYYYYSKVAQNEVDTPDLSTNYVDEETESLTRSESDSHLFNIGDGLTVYLDVDTIIKLNNSIHHSYLLIFVNLLVGTYLFLVAGMEEYKILITFAFGCHLFTLLLGSYSIKKRVVLLLLHLSIYSIAALFITIAVFVISVIENDYKVSILVLIFLVFVVTIQILGVHHMLSLALVLRELQYRAHQSEAQQEEEATVPLPTVAQPTYIPPQPLPMPLSTQSINSFDYLPQPQPQLQQPPQYNYYYYYTQPPPVTPQMI
ncbi:hypothetical protein SAMD00019534_081320, partial [Acytostelium subglobosum LB1]|uniref:hypothetical protein n=1 Tax=Acytostelium subglobosum LB1 TaxID=1410327 RepID=UPI000644FD04